MQYPQKGFTKVHNAIAKALSELGATTLFGLIGDGNLFIADSFVRHCGGEYIAAAHEAGAAMMALGYTQVSGKMGVATTTHGPGLANALPALIEGTRSTIPMMLLCGDTAVADRDHIQNVNQQALVLATGAGFEQVRSPATLVQDISRVFRRATLERRPIVLNIPVEFQWLDVEYLPANTYAVEPRGAAGPGDELDNAIGIIASAKRPIVMAGRGASLPHIKEAIVRLADRIDAMLATSLKGRELFRGHDFNIGIFGTLSTSVALDIIAKSDCVIAFGASLNKFTTAQGSLLRGKRVVQINLEQEEVGKNIKPDAGLVGDLAQTAELIVHWLDEAEIPKSGFRNADIKQAIAAYRHASTVLNIPGDPAPGTIDIRKALIRLNEAIPADRILATDIGRFLQEAWSVVDVADPRKFLPSLGFGSVGLGLPVAIGAGIASKHTPAVLVTGDGGFMLGGMTEFNTAVRSRSDLIVIVCNDASYGAEHVQYVQRQLGPELAVMDWPDLAPVAISLGGSGVTVRNDRDLEDAVTAIQKRNRPLLIDLKLDPHRMPFLDH